MGFISKVELKRQLLQMGVMVVEGNYVRKSDILFYLSNKYKITAGKLVDLNRFKQKKEEEKETRLLELLRENETNRNDDEDSDKDSAWDEEDSDEDSAWDEEDERKREKAHEKKVGKEKTQQNRLDKNCEKAAKALKDALATKQVQKGKMTLEHTSIWSASIKEGVNIIINWEIGKHFSATHYTSYYGGRKWASGTGKDQYQIILPVGKFDNKHHELGTNTEAAADKIMKLIGTNPFTDVKSYTDAKGKPFYIFKDMRDSKYKGFRPDLVTENNKWQDGGMTQGCETAKQALMALSNYQTTVSR